MSRYALRITEETRDLVEFLSPWGRPQVKEYETYFLFTVDSPTTTTDYDIVAEDDLYGYDGHLKDTRRILL